MTTNSITTGTINTYTPTVCPTCGHCPTCGNHRHTFNPWTWAQTSSGTTTVYNIQDSTTYSS